MGRTTQKTAGRRAGTTAALLAILVGLVPSVSAAPAKADLVVIALAKPPASRVAGQTFTVKDTVQNKGKAAAKPSTVRYYLSVNKKKDAGDIRLVGGRKVGRLKPNKKSKGSAKVGVPASMSAGAYKLIACADDRKVVKEKVETNNCRVALGKINITLPHVPDTMPPGAPQLNSTSPASPSSNNSPTVTGSAESGSLVQIYAGTTCSGAPLAIGTASQAASFSATVSVASDSTTQLSAKATDSSNNVSNCGGSLTYVEDSTGPASAPSVTNSTPQSPSNDETPTVTGSADDGTHIKIYSSATCTGQPIGQGTAADFEGSGIGVTVPQNATTQLHATQSDDVGNPSPCSAPFAYTEDSAAPAVPDITDSSPASGSDENDPEIIGTAEPNSTVRLYATVDCSGTPLATGSAATFMSSGLTINVPNNSTTELRATATDALGNASTCAVTPDFTYIEDSTPNEVEPNNNSSEANAFAGVHPRIKGVVNGTADVDYFSVTVPAGGSITAETRNSSFTGCSSDTTLALYGSDGSTLLASDNDSGIGLCSLIDGTYGAPPHPGARGLAAGTYYLAVDSSENSAVSYQLRVTVALAPAAGEVEPNGTTAQADARAADPSPVVSNGNSVIAGSIGSIGDKDVFRLDLTAASIIRIESFDASGVDCVVGSEPVVRVINSSGVNTYTDNASGIGSCGALSVRLSSGTSYIQVEDAGNDQTIAAYRLEAAKFTLAPNESENNGTLATADPLGGNGVTLSGDHEIAADVDFFSFTVTDGKSVRAEIIEDNVETCESNGVNSRLALLDSAGNLLAEDDDGGRGACSLIDGTGGVPKDAGVHNLGAGTYYLRVDATQATVAPAAQQFDYRLTLTTR